MLRAISRTPEKVREQVGLCFRILYRRTKQLIATIISWIWWIIYSIIDLFRNSLKWWAGVWVGTLLVMFIVYFSLITYSPTFRSLTGWMGGRAIDGSTTLSTMIFGNNG